MHLLTFLLLNLLLLMSLQNALVVTGTECNQLLQENYSEATSMIFEGLPYSSNCKLQRLKLIQSYVTIEKDRIIVHTLGKGSASQKQFTIDRKKIAPKVKPIIKNNILKNNEEITKRSEEQRNKRKNTKRGDHVINNDVLKVYRKIIDLFIKMQFGLAYEDLRPYLDDDSSVVRARNNPLDDRNMELYIESMVAYFDESQAYIDANAFNYGIFINEFIEICATWMAHRYSGDRDMRSRDRINAFVDYFNTSWIYVDFAALENWIQNGGEYRRFTNARYAVQRMFERLTENHVNVTQEWIIALREAYKKYKKDH